MKDRRTVLKELGTGVAIVAAGGTGVAAGRDGGGGGGGDGDAKLRAAHAVPDAPAVDVYVGVAPEDDDPTVAGLEFGEVTGYLELAAGEYEVTVTVAGKTNPVGPTPITVDLAAEDYTAAATGNLSPEGDEDGFGLDVFEDKLGVLDDGDGRVRAYHLSPDAPAVDVAVADEDDEPALFLAQGIEFGEAGGNVEVEAGTYPVAVYPAGSSDPVFGPVDVTVEDGEVLSAFAEGELSPESGDSGFTVVTSSEDAAPPDRADRGRGRGN